MQRMVNGVLQDLTPAEVAEIQNAPPPVRPVPSSVTNYQGRAIMRTTFLTDGRSLFTAVNEDLKAAVAATQALPETDPRRIEAEVSFQAWEFANQFDRAGGLVQLLATQYGFTSEQTDEIFRQAETVTA